MDGIRRPCDKTITAFTNPHEEPARVLTLIPDPRDVGLEDLPRLASCCTRRRTASWGGGGGGGRPAAGGGVGLNDGREVIGCGIIIAVLLPRWKP